MSCCEDVILDIGYLPWNNIYVFILEGPYTQVGIFSNLLFSARKLSYFVFLCWLVGDLVWYYSI